ncbi:hypothetical protein UNDYM_4242 [Undibacterium sp. YM2]|uniref:hypothetical protein n=1 Tax=Undibacterium sp. YM2 TaxID=2058625 RepID=UPI001331E06A|nr:hypothetical protein [Undibacterium sp. YM2]BBB68495.1 hypothetical protein UNDYM_4242 [Undibacterium sp. YM2]
MFSFFKKKKIPLKHDLEQVIYDVAEYQTDEGFHLLYQLMEKRSVFVPADPASLPKAATPGEKYVTTAADRVLLRYVTLPNNQLAVPGYTRKDMPNLANGYVEMEWLELLQMALKLDASFYGVLIQGQKSWVAFDRERIQYILKLSGMQFNSP